MRLLSIIVCAFLCISASGRNGPDVKAAATIDITSMITDRNMKIGFSHPFSMNFSAEGSMALQIPWSRKLTPEETGHYSMLTGADEPEKRVIPDLRPEFMMGIRYWPRGFCDGIYMGIYFSHGIKARPDMAVGCGYAFRIWKGLGLTAGYETRVIESLREGIFGTEGITIGINYIF